MVMSLEKENLVQLLAYSVFFVLSYSLWIKIEVHSISNIPVLINNVSGHIYYK